MLYIFELFRYLSQCAVSESEIKAFHCERRAAAPHFQDKEAMSLTVPDVPWPLWGS